MRQQEARFVVKFTGGMSEAAGISSAIKRRRPNAHIGGALVLRPTTNAYSKPGGFFSGFRGEQAQIGSALVDNGGPRCSVIASLRERHLNWKMIMKLLKALSACLILTSGAAFAFDTSHLERLRATGSCEKCDLSKAQLKGASNLVGANLNGTNLWAAYLAGANLAGASLNAANLTRANLAGANLSGASLRVTNLSGANLAGANLSRANLANSDLSRANLEGANLSGADLSGATLDGAILTNAVGVKRN
jgi:hypothetical protein